MKKTAQILLFALSISSAVHGDTRAPIELGETAIVSTEAGTALSAEFRASLAKQLKELPPVGRSSRLVLHASLTRFERSEDRVDCEVSTLLRTKDGKLLGGATGRATVLGRDGQKTALDHAVHSALVVIAKFKP